MIDLKTPQIYDVFGGDYSSLYDTVYQQKNYDAECDFIENIIHEHGLLATRTILDLGCGTGGHTYVLARRNYKVTGVDGSEDMLRIATDKFERSGISANLFQHDIRTLRLEKRYDCVISMFAVMGYLQSNNDFAEGLMTARRHLLPEGIFIFEVWNGLAVLSQKPSVRYNKYLLENQKVLRLVTPHLDVQNHLCRNEYHIHIIRNGCVAHSIKETHTMRFFFPQEIAYYLEQSGFKVVEMCSFPDRQKPIDEKMWNIAIIAKATG